MDYLHILRKTIIMIGRSPGYQRYLKRRRRYLDEKNNKTKLSMATWWKKIRNIEKHGTIEERNRKTSREYQRRKRARFLSGQMPGAGMSENVPQASSVLSPMPQKYRE